jgi:hypothetical protein
MYDAGYQKIFDAQDIHPAHNSKSIPAELHIHFLVKVSEIMEVKKHDHCPYVPLSQYKWSYLALLMTERGQCYGVTLPFNPTVYCLVAAFHAVTVWVALSVDFQLLFTFKRWTTLYFWYAVALLLPSYPPSY